MTISSHVKGDSDDLLEITSYSEYSRNFYSGKPVTILPTLFDGDFTDVFLPKLNVYIVNNSNKTLNVSSLELAVSRSEPDRRPFFNIVTYPQCNMMGIFNLGYSNEPFLELSYRILKKGESFDGRYDRKRVLPAQGGKIDFLDDLVSMGYDYNAMKRANPGAEEDPESDYRRHVWIGRLSESQMERLFRPFAVKKSMVGSGRYTEPFFEVLAPIYGELKCPGSGKTFRFEGALSLGDSGEYGAEMEEDDSFDVRLEESGSDYRIRYPYYDSIEPGGSVKVGMTLYCPKSSYHHFTVSVKDENGRAIKSRNVSLQYFFPRNSSPIKGYADE